MSEKIIRFIALFFIFMAGANTGAKIMKNAIMKHGVEHVMGAEYKHRCCYAECK